jgi:hypothetical protein
VGFSQTSSAPGRFGEALSYPAIGTAYVSISQLALSQTPGGVNSLSIWFFYPSGRSANDVLALLPSAPRLDLWFTRGRYLCINTGAGNCWGIEDNTLLDRWVHVVALFVNGPIAHDSLYIDGQNRSAACLTSAGFYSCEASGAAGLPLQLGGESDYPFHGMLDDVRIYNRALSAGEVSALYTGTACP